MIDVTQINNFYTTVQGKNVISEIKRLILTTWQNTKYESIVGLGYVMPYLDIFIESNNVISLMLAQQGVTNWTVNHKNRSILTYEDSLPLSDQSVDKILCIHSFEHCCRAEQLLAEAWRVLKGEGRILIVVPNRNSMWLHSDLSPFSSGYPYTLTQLSRLLIANRFIPTQNFRGLFMLSSNNLFYPWINIALEKINSKLFNKFSTIIAIEARKNIYAGIPTSSDKQLLIGKRVVGKIITVPITRSN